MTLDNIRLYDIAVYTQIYLEHVKAGMYLKVNARLKDLRKELADIFVRMSNQDLTSMTKRELAELIAELRSVQGLIYGTIAAEIANEIEDFVGEIRTRLTTAFAGTQQQDKPPTESQIRETSKSSESQDSGIYGIVGIATTAALLAKIMKTKNPASGLTIEEAITGWRENSEFFVESLLVRARSNGLDFEQLSQIVFGTPDPSLLSGIAKANAIQRITATADALVDTVVQQAGQDTLAAVASAYTRRYRWVSVIDSRTTELCKSRNGKVYEYGKGPTPPAHYRCRSTIAPLMNDDDEYSPSLDAWAADKPAITRRIAAAIESDERFNPLTEPQVSHILNSMTGR